MRLLILTQKVDQDDAILGFFHNWLIKFSGSFDKITVVCLERGQHNLPDNIKVLSLGKEKKISRWQYVLNFYKYIFEERKNYDVVFSHMNQEYILLGAIFWKIMGKKIALWRNHKQGNFLTRLAVFLSNVVFCTSNESFTKRFSKTKIMPVGIDTDLFFKDQTIKKRNNSILFLSRMAPLKNPEVLLEALSILKKQQIDFTAVFIGDPLEEHQDFYQQLKINTKSSGLSDRVEWQPAVANWQTPKIYNQFSIFVNLTPSGSLDKTIFEAMACQSLVVSSNPVLTNKIPAIFLFNYRDSNDLADKLSKVLLLSTKDSDKYGSDFRNYVIKNHSLGLLVDKLKINLEAL